MPDVAKLPSSSEWGHQCPPISPDEIVARLRKGTEVAIDDYGALLDGPIPCSDAPGYSRVSVELPLQPVFFGQLMNGPTGYRAHHAAGIAIGESFNRRLVEAVAPLLVSAEHLYQDKFDRLLCQRSLLGTYSKFWFTKDLSDPANSSRLLTYPEVIRFSLWREFWATRSKPRKGLLAPNPEISAVLLNGTFVDLRGTEYEQKPGRSKELHETGWT
jgi:hypothetical protein